MRNLIRLFGLIALVAVIGFSFAACGEGADGKDGVDGKDGTDGTDGTPGADGGMIPYIPAESGLLGTVWDQGGSVPYQTLIISGDGYTFTRISTISTTYQLLSYWKGPDGAVTLQLLYDGNTNTIARIGISGNTLTWGSTTLIKLDGKTTSIPAESGLRGTTWTYAENDKVIFNNDGTTVTTTYGSGATRQVEAYLKGTDSSHIVFCSGTFFTISGNTLKWDTYNDIYTKEE
jgi:hypothetical protein